MGRTISKWAARFKTGQFLNWAVTYLAARVEPDPNPNSNLLLSRISNRQSDLQPSVFPPDAKPPNGRALDLALSLRTNL